MVRIITNTDHWLLKSRRDDLGHGKVVYLFANALIVTGHMICFRIWSPVDQYTIVQLGDGQGSRDSDLLQF